MAVGIGLLATLGVTLGHTGINQAAGTGALWCVGGAEVSHGSHTVTVPTVCVPGP
jgi:hypothetical protein